MAIQTIIIPNCDKSYEGRKEWPMREQLTPGNLQRFRMMGESPSLGVTISWDLPALCPGEEGVCYSRKNELCPWRPWAGKQLGIFLNWEEGFSTMGQRERRHMGGGKLGVGVSTGDVFCFRIRFVNEATCPTAWYRGLVLDIQHYTEEDPTQQHEGGTWVLGGCCAQAHHSYLGHPPLCC